MYTKAPEADYIDAVVVTVLQARVWGWDWGGRSELCASACALAARLHTPQRRSIARRS